LTNGNINVLVSEQCSWLIMTDLTYWRNGIFQLP